MTELNTVVQDILDGLLARRPELKDCTLDLLDAYRTLVKTYDAGGKLFICGNGGSHADAVHIAGELCKSFERVRSIPQNLIDNLQGLPWGEELAEHLEAGLPAIPLGASGALKTAVENDSELRDIAFAQELNALAKPEDVLLAISTSGNAVNCLMAQSTAQAIGCATIALTGPHGGKLAMHAGLAIKAPGESTAVVQEAHIALWHALCLMVEAHYFPDKR